MSDSSTTARPNASRRSGPRRLPLWGPPVLLVLASIVGIVLALPTGSIGLPFLVSFAVAAVIGTLFVDPRGLVITVAQQPLLFTILTPVSTWLIASWSDPAVGGALDTTPTKTRLITSAYPIVQYFPWMALIPLVCAAIAIWRYLDITRVNAKSQKEARRDSARIHKAEEATTTSATQARRRVAESDERRTRHVRAETASRRPASEIIQAAEERRRRAAERARLAQQARVAQRADDDVPAPRRRDPRAEQRAMEHRAASARPDRTDRTARRAAAQPDDHRRAVRRIDPRREDPRREDPRRDDHLRDAGYGQQRREAPQRRRPVEEWPPRRERPRHAPRDDRGMRDDRREGPRDPRGRY